MVPPGDQIEQDDTSVARSSTSRPSLRGLLSRLSPSARQAVVIGLAGNGILFIVKLGLGWHINSLSVVADGFHSLSDSFTTLLVLLGLWAAAKAPDDHHPFGHGRAEYIGTLVLAVFLIVIGFEVGRTALSSLWEGTTRDVQVGPGILVLVLITAAFKEAMAQYIFKLGRDEDSRLIQADALHHRLDAITSLGVALGLVGVWAGLEVSDDLMALAVGIFVIYSGFDIGSEAARMLMGREPSSELEARIVKAALEIEGVHAPHRIWVHDYGSSRAVTLHIGVDPALTIKEAHDLGVRVEEHLGQVVRGTITIRMDPRDIL